MTDARVASGLRQGSVTVTLTVDATTTKQGGVIVGGNGTLVTLVGGDGQRYDRPYADLRDGKFVFVFDVPRSAVRGAALEVEQGAAKGRVGLGLTVPEGVD